MWNERFKMRTAFVCGIEVHQRAQPLNEVG
jgi:hypothetical protein